MRRCGAGFRRCGGYGSGLINTPTKRAAFQAAEKSLRHRSSRRLQFYRNQKCSIFAGKLFTRKSSRPVGRIKRSRGSFRPPISFAKKNVSFLIKSLLLHSGAFALARRYQDFSFPGSLVPVALPDLARPRFSASGACFILLSII